jgi:hypothetical protein
MEFVPMSCFQDIVIFVRIHKYNFQIMMMMILTIIIIIIIIFFHGLGRLPSSSIKALPSFPRVSTITSSSSFVVEVVFWASGVVHSFKMVDAE